MEALVFVWPYAVAFWVALAWAFGGELRLDYGRRPSPSDAAQDRGSYGLVLMGNWILTVVAFFVAADIRALSIDPPRLILFWTGVALLVAGGALRRHCFRMLGRSFTTRVQVRPGQAIVETGAYRWVRHPSYSGALLMYLGIGLALDNWASLAILVFGTAALYSYRVRVEERALRGTLGQAYEDYMQRTTRFVPFLF